jgi:EmrB/QacA subfamily drug resistance transporter
MAKAHASAQSHALTFSDKQKKIAITVVATAFVMDLLDSTIVNIAIPSIQTNLHASYADIQWIVAGYLLAFATLLVTGGRMGDVFGYKKIFMIGVAGFTVASFLSGIAWDPSILILTRVLQGSMAALMVPQVISTMQIMYKPEERGAINGLFGMLGGLSASLGPVIGGLLIKANVAGLDWRPIFLINVPIGIAALFLASRFLPNGKSTHPLKLDFVGTILLVGALGLLIFPLIQGREYGWPAWTFVLIGLAIPLFVLFVLSQIRKDRKDGSSLIAPSLFKKRSFGVGLGINLVFEMAMLGFFLTFGLFAQIGLGYTPIHAALNGLPIAVGITFAMIAFGQTLIPKLGRKALQIGSVVMALGLLITNLAIFAFGPSINSFEFIPGLLITGFGMGFFFGSLFAAVLNDVDPQHAGSASGTLNAIQQIGGAIGIAIIGVIFFGQLTAGSATHFDTTTAKLRSDLSAQHVPASAQTSIIAGVKQCFVDRNAEKDSSVVPKSCASATNAPSLSPAISADIASAAKTANTVNFQYAFRAAFFFELGAIALSVILSFFLPKHFRKEAYEG